MSQFMVKVMRKVTARYGIMRSGTIRSNPREALTSCSAPSRWLSGARVSIRRDYRWGIAA